MKKMSLLNVLYKVLGGIVRMAHHSTNMEVCRIRAPIFSWEWTKIAVSATYHLAVGAQTLADCEVHPSEVIAL